MSWIRRFRDGVEGEGDGWCWMKTRGAYHKAAEQRDCVLKCNVGVRQGGSERTVWIEVHHEKKNHCDISVMLSHTFIDVIFIMRRSWEMEEAATGPLILLLRQISSQWGYNVLIRTFGSVWRQKIMWVRKAFPFRLSCCRIIFVGGF